MPDLYFDSSAIVKRYSQEQGSKWVLTVTAPAAGNGILLSEITLVEVAAALAAKARSSHGFSVAERDRAFSRFLEDCETSYLLLPVDRIVIDQAVALSLRYRLRGYDAVQLATAISAMPDLVAAGHTAITFVSSDADLLDAAQAAGLITDNPNLHGGA